MTKWNIFGKSKPKKIEPQNQSENKELGFNNMQTQQDENLNFENQTKTESMTNYHETLQTGKTSRGKKTSQASSSSNPAVWRDINAIEENIDNMHVSKSRKPTSEFEKKVDKLIKKNK